MSAGMDSNAFATATSPITLDGSQEGEAMYLYYKHCRGFDAATKGIWQQRYATMMDAVFDLKGKSMLDLGAAMGALTLSMQECGARVYGIEQNRYFVERSPFKGLLGNLILGDICEVVPTLKGESFDLIHASQILEHVLPYRHDALFRHLWRILRVGGLFFAASPMGPASDGRILEGDDCTHVCIRPKEWWETFMIHGFRDASPSYHVALQADALYQEYKWDYFLWERL